MFYCITSICYINCSFFQVGSNDYSDDYPRSYFPTLNLFDLFGGSPRKRSRMARYKLPNY